MTRHALICGASAGIGQATALALASSGHELTLVARNLEALRQTAALCDGAAKVHVLVADLDNREEAEKRIRAHIAGIGPVHILINNTGGPPSGDLLDATDADFESAFGRHLFMAQRLVRAVLPGMKVAKWGRIVNVLSTSVREPIKGLGVSNATRAAMASWAKTLSRELPPGVTINSILPGFTDTGRLGSLAKQMASKQGKTTEAIHKSWIEATPEGRLGKPQELAATIAFLCSDGAAFIRGVCLPVDGGRLSSI